MQIVVSGMHRSGTNLRGGLPQAHTEGDPDAMKEVREPKTPIKQKSTVGQMGRLRTEGSGQL